MPGNLDFKVPQGETFQRNIEVIEDDGTNSAPLDITDFIIRMQVRTKASSPDIVLEASTTNGKILITDAPNGKCTITFSDPETSATAARSYVYDVEYEAPSGAVVRMLQGAFTVSAEVTR
jgi:hypothetical protein